MVTKKLLLSFLLIAGIANSGCPSEASEGIVSNAIKVAVSTLVIGVGVASVAGISYALWSKFSAKGRYNSAKKTMSKLRKQYLLQHPDLARYDFTSHVNSRWSRNNWPLVNAKNYFSNLQGDLGSAISNLEKAVAVVHGNEKKRDLYSKCSSLYVEAQAYIPVIQKVIYRIMNDRDYNFQMERYQRYLENQERLRQEALQRELYRDEKRRERLRRERQKERELELKREKLQKKKEPKVNIALNVGGGFQGDQQAYPVQQTQSVQQTQPVASTEQEQVVQDILQDMFYQPPVNPNYIPEEIEPSAPPMEDDDFFANDLDDDIYLDIGKEHDNPKISEPASYAEDYDEWLNPRSTR